VQQVLNKYLTKYPYKSTLKSLLSTSSTIFGGLSCRPPHLRCPCPKPALVAAYVAQPDGIVEDTRQAAGMGGQPHQPQVVLD